MHLDNNLVNSLLNTRNVRGSFASRPNFQNYVDEHGNVMEDKSRMPLIDFMRLLVEAGIQLHPQEIHPPNLVGIYVSTEIARSIIMNVFRAADTAPELFTTDVPLPKLVDAEVKDAVLAHKCAQKILNRIAKNKNPISMDTYVSLTNESPHPEFTEKLLVDAGPQHQEWTSPHGTLPALESQMPLTLRALNVVELAVRVKYVRESNETAMIEIVDVRDAYSKSVLRHHNEEVALSFDAKSTELDDLILLQYRKEVFSLRAAAECATLARHSAKTKLTLRKILILRDHLNKLHAEVKQTTLQFGEH